MPDRPALRCQHCGAVALPVDPGWTLREIATLLRLKPRRVESLSAQLADRLDPPLYRRLSDHPRLYRLWSARDVTLMQQALARTLVKPVRHPRPSPPALTDRPPEMSR